LFAWQQDAELAGMATSNGFTPLNWSTPQTVEQHADDGVMLKCSARRLLLNSSATDCGRTRGVDFYNDSSLRYYGFSD